MKRSPETIEAITKACKTIGLKAGLVLADDREWSMPAKVRRSREVRKLLDAHMDLPPIACPLEGVADLLQIRDEWFPGEDQARMVTGNYLARVPAYNDIRERFAALGKRLTYTTFIDHAGGRIRPRIRRI